MYAVTAILKGELDKDVCMEVLEGVTGINRNCTVHKLVKAHWAFKQAHSNWNSKIEALLRNLELIRCPARRRFLCEMDR